MIKVNNRSLSFDPKNFSDASELFYTLISALKERPTRSFFGIELAHAHYLIEETDLEQRELVRRYFLRPASEPIIFSYFDIIKKNKFTEADYLRLAEILTLNKITTRKSDTACIALESSDILDIRTAFTPKTAIKRLISAFQPNSTIDFKSYVQYLGSTIVYQPLSNSNSRTVCAFLNLAVMKRFGLQGPFASLGPAFVARPVETFKALQSLVYQNNWKPFVSLFTLALQENLLILNEKYHPAGSLVPELNRFT